MKSLIVLLVIRKLDFRPILLLASSSAGNCIQIHVAAASRVLLVGFLLLYKMALRVCLYPATTNVVQHTINKLLCPRRELLGLLSYSCVLKDKYSL